MGPSPTPTRSPPDASPRSSTSTRPAGTHRHVRVTAILRRAAPAISHTLLRQLPSTAIEYLEVFLYRRRLRSAAVHLGLTTDEIAATLSLELDTVKKYVSRIFTITRVRNRVEFVKLVYADQPVLSGPSTAQKEGDIEIDRSSSAAPS